MEFSQISVGLAFLAGLASFLSPCVFSLVPAYVGYLGGRAAGGESNSKNRWITFSHGLAFVLGFSFVFVFLGVAAAFAGGVLFDLRFWLTKIGGVVVIAFGLHMIGVFHIPFLAYDTRVQQAPDPKMGYLSSALMGVFFSAGWSPCVGPVLGAILTVVFNGGSISQGAVLLTSYSIGLGIPFLFAALGIGWVTNILRNYAKTMRYVEIVMGVILLVVGVMLLTGVFETLALQGQGFYIDFGL
ncbi:MAG TPA: cytochrome c biogenesis protein CcdA [Anaerolineales bacterium]|nr:cytochrome c biogenesis protein CcdA [Anaerolineales bacterium]HMV95320.1 cytochrome c biogenesis protein CcdA [Anaerolineales bacterium]HMX18256.1 cytochrome c biogenesis protein CcdA [Anaerolineales bacterium]HMX75051.1 cytochrome c biogenesis protein CcdA [Anaerolineales bacterium]HMZ41786.1 cytochrome c biogenesis protein CcdA [Anaerolineales bacterium]